MGIDCIFKNRVVLLMCSFDGGEPEVCAFPLELSAITYDLVPHTIEVAAYDIFGLNITIHLPLTDREFSLQS